MRVTLAQECRILEVKNISITNRKEISIDKDTIAIDYRYINDYVERIYFGPKTKRIDLFREKLYYYLRRKIPCEWSFHKLS